MTGIRRGSGLATVLTLLLTVLLCAAMPVAAAEEATPEGTAATDQAGAEASEDKTGTNPVNFTDELRLFNVFTSLPNGDYQNASTFRYIMPFNNRTMKIQLDLPLVTTDVSGETEFGFGDLDLKWMWVPSLTRKSAVAVGVESWWNTATGDALGSGKNALGPLVVYVMFLNKQTLFAPAYQYKFDIGGSDDRPDISQSFIDFYYVYLPKPGQWITLDPTIIIDHERGTTSAQVEVELGRMMSPGMSAYIRPGFPIGGNQLIDWNLEVGVKSVF